MEKSDFTHDEIVEYATNLYGEDWRNKLAENLKITRKQMILTLASGDPIPASITVPFLSLVEAHLKRQAANIEKMERRLHSIRSAEASRTQPKEVRRSAS